MARPTKATQALRKRLKLEEIERKASGTVTLFLWPVKLDKPCEVTEEQQEKRATLKALGWRQRRTYTRGGRVYCSPKCIMASRDFAWFRFDPTGREGDQREQFRLDYGDDAELTVVPPRTWPLSRYLMRKHYAADVAHFRCRECKGPLRRALTPQKRRQKQKAKREVARVNRLVKEEATRIARQLKPPTPEQVKSEEYLAMLRRMSRTTAQRKRRETARKAVGERAKLARETWQQEQTKRLRKKREANPELEALRRERDGLSEWLRRDP